MLHTHVQPNPADSSTCYVVTICRARSYHHIVPPALLPPVPQEYYEFLEQDSADIFTRLGTFAWLAMAIAFVETLVCVKFGRG